MSKSTRMTPEQLRLMNLEEVEPGVYKKKKTKIDKAVELVDTINIATAKLQNMFDGNKTERYELDEQGIIPSGTKGRFERGNDGKSVFVPDKDGQWEIVNRPNDAPPLYQIAGIDPASDEPSRSAVVKRWADGTVESVNIDSLPRPDLIEEMNNISRYHNVEIKHERQKVYVAIDPGKSGAIVFLDPNGGLNKWVMPKMGNDIDGNALYAIIEGIKDKFDPVIIIEDVHSVFGASAKANWQFGFVCGLIRAMVIAHKLPFHMIQPKDWQKVVWSNDDKVYKPKKPEQKRPQLDTKATSLKAAVRLYPNYDLRATERSKIPHDGIVDAMLMATAARRMNL